MAVGSGGITDIVRYVAHLSGRDFVSLPTAASRDGYASSVAAMQIDGVRLTYPARAPQAIFADPGVLAAAPAELSRAGLGDLLGKATARVDWLAAHLLLGEPYSEEVAARVLGPPQWAAEKAGIPPDPGYLDIDQQTLRATFRCASRLRARYAALDFLEGQGVLEQAIETEILEGPGPEGGRIHQRS